MKRQFLQPVLKGVLSVGLAIALPIIVIGMVINHRSTSDKKEGKSSNS